MDFNEAVKQRKSVRSFLKKRASWKDAIDAIDAALQGPFAGNNTNMRFIIVEDREMLQDLASLAEQLWMAEASLFIIVVSDDIHLENMYGERGRVYSRQQAGAVIQTILLSLTNTGLSGCWVGSYPDELIKEKLKIPQHMQIEAIIPVGYELPQKGSAGRKKRSLETTVHWERWGNKRRPTIFEEDKEDYRPPS